MTALLKQATGVLVSGTHPSAAQPSQRHKYLHNSHQLLSPQVRGARRRNPPPQQLTASQKLVRKQDSLHQTCYACGGRGGR